jgi:23S rRNA (pseudouridine1915-N3)-methyltransferase
MFHLIAVGRLRSGPEAELIERYNDRLRPKLHVKELPEARGATSEIKRREAGGLLGAVPMGSFVVVLDPGGESPDSVMFASLIERWLEQGRPICFLIGGAEGLDAAVLQRSDYTLSLGPMTWPHFLARVMLVEQIYRARSITSGHPYHRAGRP